VFLALVWMDSAAFYIIQHTDSLRAETWQGAWTLWGNAAMHLGAALLAGWALDRGRAGPVTLAAALLLAAACNWITDTGGELLYVAGVSLYSTALVFVAALSGRARVAALIFAVAGWGGSALGIGMAQDLHRIPVWFAPAALVVLLAGLLLARRPARGAAHLALALGVGAAALPPAARAGDDAAIARGRGVYLAEGCIHCHSQYVRPNTGDVLRWGPARPLEELLKETPPLFGNRRQGPDLLNVGNRRNPDWNRLHLIAPSLVSPGSRMPSYARLFAPGETRGEDLLAYLQSLGAGTETERAATIAQWSPAPQAIHTATTPAGAALFARLCVQCHGPSGRGDGPAAARLQAKVADLSAPGMDRDETRLARLILFGRPGTAMAGHETLADRDVVSLARYVATLQARSLPNENPGG
jgi:cytochrome c oxidase cbb3-type subunit 2